MQQQKINQEITDALNSVQIHSSWSPSDEFKSNIFSLVVKDYLSYPDNYGFKKNDEIYLTLIKKGPIEWFWNSFPELRWKTLHRLIEATTYKVNVVLSSEEKIVITDLIRAIYDSLPTMSQEVETNEFRVKLQGMLQDRSIDYAKELMSAILMKNEPLVAFWKTTGRQKSYDPNFYAMCWNRIERGKGYVDLRYDLISDASKCSDFSETIISALVDAGHSSNKVILTSAICRKIDRLRQSNVQTNEVKEKILFHQLTLARFVGTEDEEVLRTIIPYLRQEDIMFAAPAAANAGLSKMLERYMKRG